ncbi:MAG: molybdopterin-dependent oxidoreductase [Chloroflexi bacterium]|nr:molybdopterin-dependent oxidoreductase [Chloroflexota bacterium]
MVNLKIDGIDVTVPEGTTVLRAAEAAGATIPTLCDHKHLTPYGGCRLCLVEVEGARTLQPSCTLPASNGMVVLTNTPKVREARKFVLSLIFSERNHFCMYCAVSNGDCELQNSAYGEGMTHWPLQPNWLPFAVDASNPHFVLDNNRCILCRRCIRACGELVGNFTLGVEERGTKTMVVADLGVPLGESTCVSCGTCVQVCPTGAIIDRASAYKGRDKDVQHVKSTCAGCSVGCSIDMVVRDNHLLRIDGDWEAPLNEGLLCEVGRFKSLNDERERIVAPLVRKDGALKAATWDEALDLVAAKLKPLAGQNGKGIAAMASTRMTAEALYEFDQLFSEKMGAGLVTSTEQGLSANRPTNTAPCSLDALKAADCVVVVSADLGTQHQVAGFFVKRMLPKGTKLVVIDNSSDNKLAQATNYALKPLKGSDYELVMGITAAIAKSGKAKGAVPKSGLSRYTPEATRLTTGVTIETLNEVAQIIASAQRPVFVYGNNVSGGETGRMLKALANLATMTGAQTGPIGALGGANSLAAAAYQLDQAFEPQGRQVIYLALGDEKPTPRLAAQLETAPDAKVKPFIAVQASYISPVTAMADVVLPVEMWAEQEGHFLNLEGRLQETKRGVTAPDEVRSSAKVLQALAERIGVELDGNWQKDLRF